jgi:hypothetical protein
MISGVHVEVVLAASHAIFLVGVAFILELLARHPHQRSERYRHSGFVYLQDMAVPKASRIPCRIAISWRAS